MKLQTSMKKNQNKAFALQGRVRLDNAMNSIMSNNMVD